MLQKYQYNRCVLPAKQMLSVLAEGKNYDALWLPQ